MIQEIIGLLLETYKGFIRPVIARVASDKLEEAYAIVDPIVSEMVGAAYGMGLTEITYTFAVPYLERISIALREAGLSEMTS